jgi:hypothetical protein
VEQAVARLTALRTAGRRAARETSAGVAETPDLVGRTLVRSPEDAARLLYALGRLADHLRQQPPPSSAQRPGDLRAGLEAVEAAHALAVRRVREAGVPMGLDHYHLCLRFHRRSPEHARHLLEDLLRDGVRPTAATFDVRPPHPPTTSHHHHMRSHQRACVVCACVCRVYRWWWTSTAWGDPGRIG